MPVKLLTSGGGGVNLVPSSSIASDQTMYLPTSGTSGGTVLCTDSSGNLGLGVTPSAWTLFPAFQNTAGSFWGYRDPSGGQLYITQNVYYNSGFKYVESKAASMYQQNGGSHAWSIAPSGTAGNAIPFTQAMTLDSSGNLLVGTTSRDGAGGVSIVPSAVGPRIMCKGSGTTSFYDAIQIYSTGASDYRFFVGYDGTVHAVNTTISAISDIRYKENIRDLDDGLATIMSLKPRKFDWKEGKGKNIKNDRGFIAQELEQVLPELIDTWKGEAPEGEEPYKSVRQDLIPILVKAIQELTQRIEALEYTKQGE